ncbi:MAG TPA: hypothetical protein VMM79_16235 [Longimicrobiales bacterium]|nr:hypothetical protein [Longimicrobiales bacterium]
MPHLHGMSAAFAEALGRHATEAREIGCSFAGRPVRLRVAGSTLAQRTQRAFAHLRIGDDAQASALRIDLWDETETGVPCPSSDPAAEPERAWVACGGSLGASPDGRYVSFRYGDSVTVLDRDGQHMIGCRRDGSHLSGGEYSKPLLLLLSIWYYDRGVQLLHAGLLARDGMGVLLPGDSGTGKSTTCLAGLTQGLEFLGDDFIGIERAGAGTFLGHSIFNTACLASRNLGRFPDLEPLAVASASPEEEKPILFLSEIHPERLRATVPVRAVVLLRIRSERTEIRPATRVEALRQFAASTLHTVVPRPGREALRMIAEVVESVPAYWLLLGPDMRDIGPGIDGILARACGVDAA